MKYKKEIQFYVDIGVCTTSWKDRKVDQLFKILHNTAFDPNDKSKFIIRYFT